MVQERLWPDSQNRHWPGHKRSRCAASPRNQPWSQPAAGRPASREQCGETHPASHPCAISWLPESSQMDRRRRDIDIEERRRSVCCRWDGSRSCAKNSSRLSAGDTSNDMPVCRRRWCQTVRLRCRRVDSCNQSRPRCSRRRASRRTRCCSDPCPGQKHRLLRSVSTRRRRWLQWRDARDEGRQGGRRALWRCRLRQHPHVGCWSPIPRPWWLRRETPSALRWSPLL